MKRKSSGKSGLQRTGKSDKELQRRRGNQPPKEYILIVVEGQKTEYNYFQSLKEDLRLSTVQIKVEAAAGGKTGDARKIVETAKDLMEKKNPDRLYCVFDGDRPEFKEAVTQAKKSQLLAVTSVPCFEIWFLLHYCDTSSPFTTCQEVSQRLEPYLEKAGILKKGDRYQKNLPLYESLKDYQQIAIQRAEKLTKNRQDNPSTQVHELVQYLKNQS
jgi:hypothetical protein